MRAIKFRFFVTDGVITSDFEVRDMTINKIMQKFADDGNVIPMQYTGLKDINDNPIYEGDIVTCVYDFIDMGTHVVKWGGDYPAFDLYNKKGFCELSSDAEYNVLSDDNYNFEVIGNIYQNPELMESK